MARDGWTMKRKVTPLGPITGTPRYYKPGDDSAYPGLPAVARAYYPDLVVGGVPDWVAPKPAARPPAAGARGGGGERAGRRGTTAEEEGPEAQKTNEGPRRTFTKVQARPDQGIGREAEHVPGARHGRSPSALSTRPLCWPETRPRSSKNWPKKREENITTAPRG